MKALHELGLGPTLLWLAYFAGDAATLIYLTFMDGYTYNGWNWLIAIPVNVFLATIWPAYWLILRPLLG